VTSVRLEYAANICTTVQGPEVAGFVSEVAIDQIIISRSQESVDYTFFGERADDLIAPGSPLAVVSISNLDDGRDVILRLSASGHAVKLDVQDQSI